jgi:MerR family mercuric resistance operon transcriptional regulator
MKLTIGNAAKALGISVETIRFYERSGLIAQPSKPAIGYREYPQETVDRVRFIRQAQGLGFQLDEILTLLAISTKCDQVEVMATEKLATVKAKIDQLTRLAIALEDSVMRCQSNNDNTQCPIVDSLVPVP